jgi:uncharacterized phage protein (TIGR02218 family)
MAGHLAGTAHTRCNMLLLDLQDGSRIGITDHDKDLSFDVGDGLVTYNSGTGILISNVALSCGLEADNFEVKGPIADIVTREGVIGGRFNRARARLFEVNWKDLTQGYIPILAGNVSEARVEGGQFVMEIRADVDRFNQTVGRVITDQCDADFGDGIRCHATPVSIIGTVTAATDGMGFTVSFTGSYADTFFNKGTVQFLTGALAGTAKVEIQSWTAAGVIQLFVPVASIPAIGDTCTIRQGCYDPATGQSKSRAACMTFGQILHFRGYPEVPGRKALMPAIPGQ